MNKFETELELGGETRPLRVSYEAVWGDLYLEKIEIALDVNETYSTLGIYDPRPVRRWLDITRVVSDIQALALTREIQEAAQKASAEDYDDSRLMAWEERRRYARAA